jgi:hypothetical protein
VDDAAGLVLGVDPLHVREGDAEDIILGGGDLARVGELDVDAVEADPLGVDDDVLLLLEGRLQLAGDLVELVLEGLVDGDRVLEVEAALEVEAELEAALEGVGDPGRQLLVGAEDLRDRGHHHEHAEDDQREQQQGLGLEEATHGL